MEGFKKQKMTKEEQLQESVNQSLELKDQELNLKAEEVVNFFLINGSEDAESIKLLGELQDKFYQEMIDKNLSEREMNEKVAEVMIRGKFYRKVVEIYDDLGRLSDAEGDTGSADIFYEKADKYMALFKAEKNK